MRHTVLACVLVVACGGGGTSSDQPDAAPVADATAGDPITIRFAAKVGTSDFACGQTYANLGTPPASYQVQDFRMYIHDLVLLGDGGARVAVALDQDGQFQRANVALLDFEDGGAGCPGGTTAMHTSITARAPAGTYTGVEFEIGVPADLDHLDASTATPPLDDTTLWWVWRSGYKYVRIDGMANDVVGFPFHLGATGCPGSSAISPPTGPCDQPNLPKITLTGFDPATTTIVADLAGLFATTNLGVNANSSAQGCQSDTTDTDCGAVFASIGLPFAGAGAGSQVFLRAS